MGPKLFSILLIFLSPLLMRAQSAIVHFADSLRQAEDIPALAFAVVSGDSVLSLAVLGSARIDSTGFLHEKSAFHLGSNTKALSSFAAAILVEQNLLQWDTPFFALFPEWKAESRKQYHDITLSDLLSHRAGIHAFTSGKDFARLPDFAGSESERRRLFGQWLLLQKPVGPLGEINYSNAGYSLAALMMEAVSGKSWEALMQQIFWKENGLEIGFGWPNRSDIANPWGHWEEAGEVTALAPDHFYALDPITAPAGDIFMNMPDYARFLQWHLRGLQGEDAVLSPETWQYLHYGEPDYAMGWGWKTRNDQKLSFHDGSAGTFYSHVLILPHEDLALAIFANRADKSSTAAIYKLSEEIRKRMTQP